MFLKQKLVLTVCLLLVFVNAIMISFYIGRKSAYKQIKATFLTERYRLQRLQREINKLQALQRGVKLEPFQALTLKGVPYAVKYGRSSKVKILYYFSVKCPSCIRNIDFMNQLFKDYGGHIEILGLSTNDLEDTQKYAKASKFKDAARKCKFAFL